MLSIIFLNDAERAQHDKGWPIAAIAEAFLLSEDAIREHIHEYRESNELAAHLRKHTYLRFKDIIAYAQSTLPVTYSVLGMRNWLQRHGFSYKLMKRSVLWTEFIPRIMCNQLMVGSKKGIRKEVPANSGKSRVKEYTTADPIFRKRNERFPSLLSNEISSIATIIFLGLPFPRTFTFQTPSPSTLIPLTSPRIVGVFTHTVQGNLGVACLLVCKPRNKW